MAVLLAVAVAGLAGCGGESSAATLTSTLKYARGGGFAGVMDQLTIQRDGRASVTTRRGRHAFTLSGAERTRLEKALTKADLAHQNPVRTGAAVPDAFGYELRYRGHVVAFDDTSMPKPVGDLVSALDGLVSKHGAR